jgi:hypothetical protein
LLFDLGVPLRMAMEILGHAQIAATSDLYTHVMPAPYAEVADALDAWFGMTARRRRPGDDRRKVQRKVQLQPVGCGSALSGNVSAGQG